MRNTLLLVPAIAMFLFFGVLTKADATPVAFEFEGTLIQVSGPNGLMAGDPFTGMFSYSPGQIGTDVPLVIPGEKTRYALDSFSVTISSQMASSIGGYIDISNDNLPFPAFPDIIWDRVDLDPGPDAGASISGSINGFHVSDFLLSLVNIGGAPFSDTTLPDSINLLDFPDLRRVDVIFSDGGGAVIGEISQLHPKVVPEPSTLFLVALGLSSLFVRIGLKVKA